MHDRARDKFDQQAGSGLGLFGAGILAGWLAGFFTFCALFLMRKP